MTSTEPTTQDPSTEPATAPRRRTRKRADAESSVGGQSVGDAVRRDLALIRQRSPELADSALAATALALAREIDADNSATSKSMCANSLRDILDRLRELMPAEEVGDELDDLVARRAARLARKSAS